MPGRSARRTTAGPSRTLVPNMVVGLDAERPFRVRAGADPGTVVVQVLTS